jgi:hypothetical protein
VLEDGDGYFVTDGEEESDNADWSVPVEFKGVRYLGETDGETASLSIVTAVDPGQWEEIDEADLDADGDGGPDGGEEVAA